MYDGRATSITTRSQAFIKSMRGSDPDAAVYWLARMLEAGEDPRFIARRIAILASEDIGNADPRAIQVAAAAYDITERIGMPECQLTLGQAAIYMATRAQVQPLALAIWGAMKDVREGRTVPVPKHLRDGHYPGAKDLGHAEGYQYSHNSRQVRLGRSGLPRRGQDILRTDRAGPRAANRQFLKWIAEQKPARAERGRGEILEVLTATRPIMTPMRGARWYYLPKWAD